MSSSTNLPRHHSGIESRTGYVALVGRPNAGKSTLMNAFLGEHLSIVTPKAQTTWRRVTGILSDEAAGIQMIFLDTPGLLAPTDLLQQAMLAAAKEAMEEADVILLVLDAAAPADPRSLGSLEGVLEGASNVPLLAAVNKCDAAPTGRVADLCTWAGEALGAEPHQVSALEGQGIDGLKTRIGEVLPPGPFLYPSEDIARDPVRFFVAEMIRESVFEMFRQEVPYSVFCAIEEYRESQDPIYIQAHLFVERKSQKGILLGKGGSSIRRLGTASRKKIEDFLQRKVYLDLWIKVLPDWRRKRGHLKRLGFPVPDPEATGGTH